MKLLAPIRFFTTSSIYLTFTFFLYIWGLLVSDGLSKSGENDDINIEEVRSSLGCRGDQHSISQNHAIEVIGGVCTVMSQTLVKDG